MGPSGAAEFPKLIFKETSEGTDPLTYRWLALLISVPLAIWAFLIFDDNLFTPFNVTVWYFAIAFFLWAFWLKDRSIWSVLQSAGAFLRRGSWIVNISSWTLLVIAATVLVFFFRFHQTTSVPPEPFSDHAEKILDVYAVSQGQTHIFFTRNTGREAIQMYWTLFVANVFGTGLSYLSLKLGTAILGLLTLPFIYLLGKALPGLRQGGGDDPDPPRAPRKSHCQSGESDWIDRRLDRQLSVTF